MNLAVYGTLQPQHERWHFIQPYVKDYYPITLINVELRDAGPFPIARRSEGAVTHGWLLECDDDFDRVDALLTITEAIEGGMYQFRPVTCRLIGGPAVVAWTYLGVPELHYEMIPVMTEGRWMQEKLGLPSREDVDVEWDMTLS